MPQQKKLIQSIKKYNQKVLTLRNNAMQENPGFDAHIQL